MRRLVYLSVMGFAAWSAWWFFAAYTWSQETEQWFAERRAEGWQADLGSVSVSGFPFQLNAVITVPSLADPETGVAFSASELRSSAPAWWPGYVTLHLPSDGLHFATPREKRALFIENGSIALRLKPGNALEVENLALTGGPLRVTRNYTEEFSAAEVIFELKQDTATSNGYSAKMDIGALRPSEEQRASLLVSDALPDAYESLILDLEVVLSQPIDRKTLEESRPQPQIINLRLAEAVWGPMQLRAHAEMQVDPAGRANGDITFQARQWREMLDLLVSARLIPEGPRQQLENGLAMLARGGGNPDSLDIDLTVRDGQLLLGFIPLVRLGPLRIP